MNDDILLSPHFKLSEFLASATARKYGIANIPPADKVDNLRSLCVHTLEPLRCEMGLPIIVTSGYRSRELNELITHHSSSSQHMQGCAADLYVGQAQVSGSRLNFVDSCHDSANRASTMALAAPRVQVSGDLKLETPRQRLVRAFRLIITSKSIDFDQLIIYPTFIHVSYVSPRANRHKLTRAFGNGKYCALTREEALSLT